VKSDNLAESLKRVKFDYSIALAEKKKLEKKLKQKRDKSLISRNNNFEFVSTSTSSNHSQTVSPPSVSPEALSMISSSSGSTISSGQPPYSKPSDSPPNPPPSQVQAFGCGTVLLQKPQLENLEQDHENEYLLVKPELNNKTASAQSRICTPVTNNALTSSSCSMTTTYPISTTCNMSTISPLKENKQQT
jgi:hypothetical protein